jgi:hypothetical protein
MTILQYETRVSSDGFITLPPIPEYKGRRVVVRVEEEWDKPATPSELADKTPEQDFLDFCKELNLPSHTDEEVEQAKLDYLMEKYG